jgi:hypothetical protein
MHGYDVVTGDGHKIGHVVDERDGCVIVEHGHVFKSKHAIPRDFVTVDEGENVVHATVTRDVFTDGPKVTDDWSCEETLRHYGLVDAFAQPDPETTDGSYAADDSAVAERASMRDGSDPTLDEPVAVRGRQGNAVDPTGITANRT